MVLCDRYIDFEAGITDGMVVPAVPVKSEEEEKEEKEDDDSEVLMHRLKELHIQSESLFGKRNAIKRTVPIDLEVTASTSGRAEGEAIIPELGTPVGLVGKGVYVHPPNNDSSITSGVYINNAPKAPVDREAIPFWYSKYSIRGLFAVIIEPDGIIIKVIAGDIDTLFSQAGIIIVNILNLF